MSSSPLIPDPGSERVLEIGGRLALGPSDLLIRTAFRKELEEQAGLFEALGLADLAHTLVMMKAGIIPPEAGRNLLRALMDLHNRPIDFTPDPARGDLYTNREAWLAEHCAAAGWLGAGRARREATTTAFLITLRQDLLDLAGALAATGRLMVGRAGEFCATLMSDYTYLQAAQPTTFGHYLLGFVYPLLRDLERLRGLYARVDNSPAGCGSTNGSRLPQDRPELAGLLGFAGIVAHARDAMWQADLPIEAVALLTAILVNLDRLAEDLQIFSTEEFGLVELDDRHVRASKIMPQKKNPFALTHVRGLANRMIGQLATTAAAGRTPSGQPDNRLPLYGTVLGAVRETRDAVALMGEVVQFLKFDKRRGQVLLAAGSTLATDLAEVLVLRCGLDFREAHRLVGCLARRRLGDGGMTGLTVQELATVAEGMLGRRIELDREILRQALEPEAAIAARQGPGGSAPGDMAAMISECGELLAAAEAWVRDRSERLRMGEEGLFQAVERSAGVSPANCFSRSHKGSP